MAAQTNAFLSEQLSMLQQARHESHTEFLPPGQLPWKMTPFLRMMARAWLNEHKAFTQAVVGYTEFEEKYANTDGEGRVSEFL